MRVLRGDVVFARFMGDMALGLVRAYRTLCVVFSLVFFSLVFFSLSLSSCAGLWRVC